MTGEQKQLLTNAVADDPGGLAAWARKILLRAADENLMGEKDIEEFLDTVYLLNNVNETRRAIDIVFDCFNGLLERGNQATCNKILAKVDVRRISSTLMVAFLSITLPAKPWDSGLGLRSLRERTMPWWLIAAKREPRNC